MFKQWKEYTPKEKEKLLLEAKNGNKTSELLIWKGIYGIVRNEVKRFRFNSGSLDMGDLMQEAYIPFNKAIQDFRIGNTNFTTFVILNIKRSVIRGISNKSDFIRIPEHIKETKFKIKKILLELGDESINDKNIEIISKELNIKKDKVLEINNLNISPSILDEENLKDYYEEEISDETINKIDKLKTNLTISEFAILRIYLGLGTKQLTKSMIIEKFKITRWSFDRIIIEAKKILSEVK